MKEALNTMVDSIMELTDTTLDFDFTLEDCFPATTYKRVVIDGKTYQLKMTVELERK